MDMHSRKAEKATRKYARTIIAEIQQLQKRIKEINQATQMLAKHRQNGDDTRMDNQESESKTIANEHIDDNAVIEQEKYHPHVIGCVKHMGKERCHAQQSLQELQK